MNYLAHLFLSGKNPAIRTGNFLGDWFKGNQHELLPLGIQKGIKLHRAIDQYADQHEAMKKSYLRLRAHIGRYALPVIDVLQDYFLSIHFNQFSKQQLLPFTEQCIIDLRNEAKNLPTEFEQQLAKMFHVNWLAKYGTHEGMSKSLNHLSKKARFNNEIATSWELIQLEKEKYEEEFLAFFPDMIDFVTQYKQTERIE